MGTTKSHRNLRIFCPLLGTVHYWELLLNKNGWEAGFCPLLGAFPLLGSALLGEYSVPDLRSILYLINQNPEASQEGSRYNPRTDSAEQPPPLFIGRQYFLLIFKGLQVSLNLVFDVKLEVFRRFLGHRPVVPTTAILRFSCDRLEFHKRVFLCSLT